MYRSSKSLRRKPTTFILGTDVDREELSALMDKDLEKNYSLFEDYLKEKFHLTLQIPKMAFILNMKNSSYKINLPLSEFPHIWREASVYTKKRIPFRTVRGDFVFLDCTVPRVVSDRGIDLKNLKGMDATERYFIVRSLDVEDTYKRYVKAIETKKLRNGRTNESIIRQAYLRDIHMTYSDYLLIKENEKDILSEERLKEYTPEVINKYWSQRAKTSLKKIP